MVPDDVRRQLPEHTFAIDEEIRASVYAPSRDNAASHVKAVSELERQIQSSLEILTATGGDRQRTLRRYLENKSVVAIVELLEAKALLDLSSKWRTLPDGSRDPSLQRTLLRGVQSLSGVLSEIRSDGSDA